MSHMWLKFDKHFFRWDNDLYVCACYIPPEGSPTHLVDNVKVDPYTLLEDDIIKYQSNGNVLIVGDVNARTGTLHDFIGNDEKHSQTRLLGRPQPQMYPPVALNQYTLVNRTHKHYIYIYASRPHKHFKITPKLNNMSNMEVI